MLSSNSSWPEKNAWASFFILGILLLVGLSGTGCGTADSKATATPGGSGRGGGGGRGSGGGQPVAVATVARQDVPVYLTGLGSAIAFNTVSVKSRIDGQLIQVVFQEGQTVKQGDLLAVIDTRPYEIMLSQAEAAQAKDQASLSKDQASLQDINLNLKRFQDLVSQGVISTQQRDSQKALADESGAAIKADEAAIRSDQAQIDNAKLDLVYCRITAPVTGRVGLRMVDAGNIIHASDANPMLIITQVQPIAVIFTLPSDDLPDVIRQMNRGALTVDAYSRDDQTKLGTGTLLTVDNQIDQSTGTIRLKAQFDNKDGGLWPNQFVNARLLLETRKDSVVVPAATIQRGPQGAFIFVVNKDKTVDARPVAISLTQGTIAIVQNGVSEGELVVTDGQDRLQDKSKVEVRNGGPAQNDGGSGAPGAAEGGRGSGRHRGEGGKQSGGEGSGKAPGKDKTVS